jgi:S-formylglutathione hydrolase FrmB
VTVYTPNGYGDPSNAARRYPVVYLLHGSPGNPLNFVHYGEFPQRMERAVQAGAMQPVIFVMPDGNYVGDKHGDSEWADSADRRDRFETWMVKEIVPWADSHFRTRPEPSGRYLAGVSEGGFGAVNLSLRNPRVFGGAVGLSGYYDMRHFGWGHFIFNDSDALMSLNSPLFYVSDRIATGRVPADWKNLKIFLAAGEDETPYADHTRRLGDALRAAGVRNVVVDTPQGKHDWNLWSGMFFRAMVQFLPPAAAKGQ